MHLIWQLKLSNSSLKTRRIFCFNSKISLEALKQSIKDFTLSRSSDTTTLIAALETYKTTLSTDLGDVKTDLELIANNIAAAKLRTEQFASIKCLIG